MRFLVISSSVYIFFLFNFLNGRDDGYIDTTFNDSKNTYLTSIKETTGYNSKIPKKPFSEDDRLLQWKIKTFIKTYS